MADWPLARGLIALALTRAHRDMPRDLLSCPDVLELPSILVLETTGNGHNPDRREVARFVHQRGSRRTEGGLSRSPRFLGPLVLGRGAVFFLTVVGQLNLGVMKVTQGERERE